MKCNELMSRSLKLAGLDTSVLDASRLMRDSSIGFLPVCDPHGRLVAVVTDRDIATRVAAEDLRAGDTKVGEIATKDPVVCFEDDELAQAEETMRAFQKSRVVVVDRDRHPVGVLSIADVIDGDRSGRRALKTAKAVIGRDAGGPHQPLAQIHLTPSAAGAEAVASETPAPDAQQVYESSRTAQSRDAVIGGGTNRGMKEFPS